MLHSWSVRLAVLVAVLCVTTPAGADDAELAMVTGDASVNQRLAALEAEIEQLRAASRATLTAAATFDPPVPVEEGCTPSPACEPIVGRDFFNCGCRTGGIVAGAEAVFFKPFYSANGAPNVDSTAVPAAVPSTMTTYPQLQYNYVAAPRLWVGYVGANGLGARFRFFDYYNTASSDFGVLAGAAPGNFIQNAVIALRTYDLELTQQVDFRSWRLQGFGGVRYAQSNQQSQAIGGAFVNTQASISYYGLGPTAGFQAERAVTSNGRWSIYGAGRGSLLYGNQRDNTADITGSYINGNRELNSVFASIWELSLGPQWKIRLPRGGEFFVRTTVEAQYWQGVGNFAPTPVANLFTPALNRNNDAGGFGLLGFSGAIGITR
ncbi:MAG: hypothetical protein JSS27_01880 [Planctomycetes bacterium]|nr:hypothetical protein [Planctomycetota bacterium]